MVGGEADRPREKKKKTDRPREKKKKTVLQLRPLLEKEPRIDLGPLRVVPILKAYPN